MKIKTMSIIATLALSLTPMICHNAKADCMTSQELDVRVDNFLSNLHDKLEITTSENTVWNDFARAWKDSTPPIECRMQPAPTIPERLKRENEIATNHVKRILIISKPLLTLYNSLTEDQKSIFNHYHFRGLAPFVPE